MKRVKKFFGLRKYSDKNIKRKIKLKMTKETERKIFTIYAIILIFECQAMQTLLKLFSREASLLWLMYPVRDVLCVKVWEDQLSVRIDKMLHRVSVVEETMYFFPCR